MEFSIYPIINTPSLYNQTFRMVLPRSFLTMSQFPLIILALLAAATVASATISERLVNGDVAAEGQFPYMVSLRGSASSSHFCGGSLVTPEHVTTAAHCVANTDPDAFYVVSGHQSNWEGGRYTQVSEVRVHPEYRPAATWENDIAVLKLSTPIPFTATERPIPIASVDTGVESCIASGWGRIHYPSLGLPSQLQMLIMNTMTMETCLQYVDASSIYNSTLCVGAVRGEGVCSGDSGGPVVCNGELAGVVSWGYPCAQGMPDMFARVFYYRDWLNANIADLTTLGKFYAAKAAAARTAKV